MGQNQVLVTGGAGFIGSHLVDILVSRGVQVRVLDDLSSGSMANLAQVADRIEFIQGSILDMPLIKEAAAGCHTVFHLAAIVSVPMSYADPMTAHEINVLGTLRALEAASKNGCKFILSSSAAVYQGTDNATEARLGPISPYGVHKLTCEMYTRLYHVQHGIPAACLRYFNVYGPRQDPKSPYSGVISKYIERTLAGEQHEIHGDGLQTRDFVFVRDVALANVCAMHGERLMGQAFDVGSGVQTSILELSRTLSESAMLTHSPIFMPKRTGDIRDSVADAGPAWSKLGFRAATPLERGLKETLAWAASVLPVRQGVRVPYCA